MGLFLAFTVLIWLASLGGWHLWSRSRRAADLDRIKARLAAAPERGKKSGRKGPALIEQEEQTARQMVGKLLNRFRLNARLKGLFEQAGLKWSVARTVHGTVALALCGFSGVWYLAPRFRAAAPLAALAVALLPLVYVWRKRRKRLAKFEEQFPEALEFLGRAMRAGHAFSVSLEMIHTEFREPVAGEFRRTFDEQNLGMPLDAALMKMSQRVPLMDVQFFVSAVLLQKRTGGNLAELLDKLAHLIRERFKLRGRIKAISAHGKMTGTALTLIPIVVGLMMCWVNPGYARFFADDQTGTFMIGGAVALQLIGYGVIKKIVSIEV